MKLKEILKDWILENHKKTDFLEEQFFSINELKIDELNSYPYKKSPQPDPAQYSKAWEFEDRCGNPIVVVYIESTSEFKSGFKVEGVSTLIFDPKTLPQNHKILGNLQEKIKPCPDDKRINTVYKILLEEVIPTYVLNKKPNKILFNPVSDSRKRLVDIILNKIIQKYPQLTKKNNYLIYV